LTLGKCQRNAGRFAEAAESFHRGHALGSKRRGWPYPSVEWARECERLVELDRELPAILQGAAVPESQAERLEFARLCQRYKRLPVTATRFYAAAFAEDPNAAEDQDKGYQYDAACAAVRGAAGQGEDARSLPDKVALMLRRQGLAWLRAELALSATAAQRNAAARPAVWQRLGQWRRNPDFASVREGAALDRLAEDERGPWRRFWEDVAALLKKLEQKPKTRAAG
jgi:hypothetical protein